MIKRKKWEFKCKNGKLCKFYFDFFPSFLFILLRLIYFRVVLFAIVISIIIIIVFCICCHQLVHYL